MRDGVSAQDVRRRFVGWLRWYMAEYPEKVRTDAALAKRLGVTGAAVSYLLRNESKRLPRIETVLAAQVLTGMSVDTLLFSDPPAIRPR
jgi:transcriptional regulator with XRE-family HTH domain